MSSTALDDRTALVLIDLQRGVLRLPVVHDVDGVLGNARRLVDAFRRAVLPIAFVRVNDLRPTRTDQAPPPIISSRDFDEFTEAVHPEPADIIVTKHGWDALYATDLDLQLRRRRISGIVLAGISASRGVESTARSAHVRGYNLTFASDAISDIDRASFDHSLQTIFPRIGEVDVTGTILRHVARRSGG